MGLSRLPKAIQQMHVGLGVSPGSQASELHFQLCNVTKTAVVVGRQLHGTRDRITTGERQSQSPRDVLSAGSSPQASALASWRLDPALTASCSLLA